MKPNLHFPVIKQLRRRVDSDDYKTIRQLWMDHSIAEDSRDIPGLMATLTEDCIYTVANNGATWHGREGAANFYRQLLTAFPDIHFDLQHIVIGPQGVFEEAHVTATYQSQWLDMPLPNSEPIQFNVIIFFPWDPGQRLFSGERVYYLNLGLR